MSELPNLSFHKESLRYKHSFNFKLIRHNHRSALIILEDECVCKRLGDDVGCVSPVVACSVNSHWL